MGMFDWYHLETMPTCDTCGEVMRECQGKEGPNAFIVWREGTSRMTTEHRIDEPLEDLDPGGLPKRFTFS